MTELYKKTEKFVIDSFKKAKKDDLIKHLKRTVYWVLKLAPEADEPLLIAAMAHDIERAFQVNENNNKNFKDEEQLRQHQIKGAEIIVDFLRKNNADENLINKVRILVSKHEIGGDVDSDILKDADSISFLENNIDYFINKLLSVFGKEKIKEKFDSMFNRISGDEAKKIALPLYEQAVDKLNRNH